MQPTLLIGTVAPGNPLRPIRFPLNGNELSQRYWHDHCHCIRAGVVCDRRREAVLRAVRESRRPADAVSLGARSARVSRQGERRLAGRRSHRTRSPGDRASTSAHPRRRHARRPTTRETPLRPPRPDCPRRWVDDDARTRRRVRQRLRRRSDGQLQRTSTRRIRPEASPPATRVPMLPSTRQSQFGRITLLIADRRLTIGMTIGD